MVVAELNRMRRAVSMHVRSMMRKNALIRVRMRSGTRAMSVCSPSVLTRSLTRHPRCVSRVILNHVASKAAKREDDEKREKEQEDTRASGLDPETAAQLNQTAEKHWKDVKKRKNPDGAPST